MSGNNELHLRAVCKRKFCSSSVPSNPYRGHTPVYCSVRCKNIDKIDDLRTRRKQAAIDYLGGECSVCGYNTCPAALHFHHLHDKTYNISRATTMSWERIENELKKCVLLCANCHAEVHWNKGH